MRDAPNIPPSKMPISPPPPPKKVLAFVNGVVYVRREPDVSDVSLRTAGRIAVGFAAAVMLATLLLFGLTGCSGREPCCCEARETCPKSGGTCDCRYCQCEPGCPGVCHAEASK